MSESKESDFKQSQFLQIKIKTLPNDSIKEIEKYTELLIKSLNLLSESIITDVGKFELFKDIPYESYVLPKLATKSQNKKGALDVGLITDFTQELAEVFPEEWDEWQPEMECMMAFRKMQQSNGINHHFISLITFYHLSLFVWHIGIDKVFILATRRATR